MTRLILASASPRRREILSSLRVRFERLPVEIDEGVRTGEIAEALAERLAREKATSAAGRLGPVETKADQAAPPALLVLGADTVVALGGEIFGKPRDAAGAARMLGRLSGRTHDVLTGLAVLEPATGRVESGLARTRVRFAAIGADRAAEYVASGAGRDMAGAYGIQEPGSWFVEGIEGSYTNVVGLPVELLGELLARFTLTLDDLTEP